MGKFLSVAVAVAMTACGSDEPVPSCQQAVTNFYGAGCAFINLQTNQPYTVNESIQSCKDTLVAVPDRCQSYFDDYMVCLDSATASTCANCGDEQDALFGCD